MLFIQIEAEGIITINLAVQVIDIASLVIQRILIAEQTDGKQCKRWIIIYVNVLYDLFIE